MFVYMCLTKEGKLCMPYESLQTADCQRIWKKKCQAKDPKKIKLELILFFKKYLKDYTDTGVQNLSQENYRWFL